MNYKSILNASACVLFTGLALSSISAAQAKSKGLLGGLLSVDLNIGGKHGVDADVDVGRSNHRGGGSLIDIDANLGNKRRGGGLDLDANVGGKRGRGGLLDLDVDLKGGVGR